MLGIKEVEVLQQAQGRIGVSSLISKQRQGRAWPGVSTAFAAPIGGLLLAIEEGSSFTHSGIFWRGFLATCMGVLTLHFLGEAWNNLPAILGTKFGIRRDLGCSTSVVVLLIEILCFLAHVGSACLLSTFSCL